MRQIRLADITAITPHANDKRQQQLAWMLAKQVSDNTSSNPINVLPRQMKEETHQPHHLPVTGTGDHSADCVFTEQLLRSLGTICMEILTREVVINVRNFN